MINALLLNLIVLSPAFINSEIPANKSSFNKSISIILKDEGGLSIDRDDKGGITNYGISLHYIQNLVKKNPNLISYFDINHNHIIDSYDIIHLSKKKAEYIYKKFWWDKYGYEKINYQPLADKLFDISINIGPFEIYLLLLNAYKKIDRNFKSNSSFMNEAIINNINSLTDESKAKLLLYLKDNIRQYYINLVKKYPSQRKFLKGWLRRANE